MNEQNMKEVFADATFVNDLLAMESLGEAQAALKEKGVDMEESDIVLLRDQVEKLAGKMQNGEELTPDQLDEAAGGILGGAAAFMIGAAALAIVGTLSAAISIGGATKLISSRRW